MEQEERKSSKDIRGLKSLFHSYGTEAIGLLELGSGVTVFDKWEIDCKRIDDDTSTHPPTHPPSLPPTYPPLLLLHNPIQMTILGKHVLI